MAAAKTQKRASANARRTAGKRGSQPRASTSRSRSTGSRSTAAGSRRAAPARSRKPSASRGRRPAPARSRRERGPSATTLFIIASVLFAVWTIYPVLRIQYVEQRKVQTLEAELTGIKDRNQTLRTQVDELKTPEGVEALARETLGLVKPGEQSYVVTGGSIGETTQTAGADGAELDLFWQQVLDAIFGFE